MAQQLPDTRIPLSGLGGGGGGQQQNPLGTLGQMMQIKEMQMAHQQRQMEIEKARRDQEDDDEARWTVQQHERPEDAVDALWKAGRTGAASRLGVQVYTQRKHELDTAAAKTKAMGDALGQASQIAASVTDDASLKNARPAILALVEPTYGPGIRDMIPTEYGDGSKMKQLAKMGTARAQQIQADQNLLQLQINAHNSGYTDARVDPKTGARLPPMWSRAGLETLEKYQEALARGLAGAPNKEVYDIRLAQAKATGTPKEIIDKFPPWLPDGSAPARAAELGLTLPQQATADTAALNAERLDRDSKTRAAREARVAAGGGQGALTRPQRWQIEDTQQRENKDIEEQALKWFQTDVGKKSAEWEMEKDATGKPTGKRIKPEFGVQWLSPLHQKQFAESKIAAHDKARKRNNLPTMEAGAREAAARGDVAEYTRLRDMYDNIAVEIKSLETLVPPPAGTPLTTRQKADLDQVLKQLETETDPAKRKDLEAKKQKLIGRK